MCLCISAVLHIQFTCDVCVQNFSRLDDDLKDILTDFAEESRFTYWTEVKKIMLRANFPFSPFSCVSRVSSGRVSIRSSSRKMTILVPGMQKKIWYFSKEHHLISSNMVSIYGIFSLELWPWLAKPSHAWPRPATSFHMYNFWKFSCASSDTVTDCHNNIHRIQQYIHHCMLTPKCGQDDVNKYGIVLTVC